MNVQQLKECIAKGSIHCICKPNLRITFSNLLRIFFENFSQESTMVAPVMDTGYERISSTLKVLDSYACHYTPTTCK